MKKLIVLTLAIASAFISTQALAVKQGVNLSAKNLNAHGFAVKTAKRDNGAIEITVTRDLSKARSLAAAAATDIEIVRSATLQISGPGATIVRCNLEPEPAKGTVTYHFQLAAENVPFAQLTIAEIDDYKDRANREHLIGGGTYFEMKLSDVIKP